MTRKTLSIALAAKDQRLAEQQGQIATALSNLEEQRKRLEQLMAGMIASTRKPTRNG